MKDMRTAMLASGVVLAMALASPVGAQDVKIETGPVPREAEPRLIVPGPQTERTRPPDADVYPQGTKVIHDPAFIEPLSTKTATGRAGVSGWTAPNQPVASEASGFREVNGWFALGFSFTWDGAPPPSKRPPSP
jgi:hypothetical protein